MQAVRRRDRRPGRPGAGLRTPVREDMRVVTQSPALKAAGAKVLSGLLGNHNANCLPSCQTECPVGTAVAGLVGLIPQGKYTKATALVKERVPVTGRRAWPGSDCTGAGCTGAVRSDKMPRSRFRAA